MPSPVANADWDKLEQDVVKRIRCLRAIAEKLPEDDTKDAIVRDLIIPCVRLLAGFCTAITIEEQDAAHERN